MAMDGAVVLALHSDTLFMEPLIAQARGLPANMGR